METPTNFEKTVILTLPPGDQGPICSYSPICSPSSRPLAYWRLATLMMTEAPIEVTPDNDREVISKWILQLVHRELAGALEEAEEIEKMKLAIPIDDSTAGLILTALDIKIRKLGLQR